MRRYIDDSSGLCIVEVDDLSYLSDRDHPYNWFQRHFHHHRLRLALKKADNIIVPDENVATDLVRYYFVSKDRIIIRH